MGGERDTSTTTLDNGTARRTSLKELHLTLALRDVEDELAFFESLGVETDIHRPHLRDAIVREVRTEFVDDLREHDADLCLDLRETVGLLRECGALLLPLFELAFERGRRKEHGAFAAFDDHLPVALRNIGSGC